MPDSGFHLHPQGVLTEARDLIRDTYRSLTVTDKRLLSACKNGNTDEVNSLLNRGANANARNSEGKTALMLATSFGADRQQQNEEDARNNRRTAFNMVNLLLRAGAEVDAPDNKRNTALILASRNGRHEIVDALINAGADVNAFNRKSWTGLMRAVNSGFPVTALVLLRNGADKNMINEDSQKAIDILRNNPKAMRKFLGTEALSLLEEE